MWKHIIYHGLGNQWERIKYWSFNFIENILPIFIQKAICCFAERLITIEQITKVCLHPENEKKTRKKILFSILYFHCRNIFKITEIKNEISPGNLECHPQIVRVQMNFAILLLWFTVESNCKFWIQKCEIAHATTLDW